MKILLIQPPSVPEWSRHVFAYEPLALEYVGAGLKQDGHEVQLLDARFDSDVEATFRQVRPDVVGLTAYTVHVPWVRTLAERLKAVDADVFIVVGGHHATVRPEDFNSPALDAVVVGEGVFTMRQLLARRQSGQPLDSVPGVALPGAPQRLTPPRPYTELDELPFPDRSLTVRYRQRYFGEWLKPLASVRTSLGCTSRCNFCALWSITGGKYLRRQPEAVVEELRGIAEPNVFFCDDESMVDARRMDRLADLILQAGLQKKYFLYARVDTIVRHPELFTKWRRAGLAQVFVGLESFSDSRLSGMSKGTTIAQQLEAAKILRDLNILLYGSLIVEPDFSREDFQELVRFVRKLDLRYASFAVLTPFPGTRLYAEREGELLSRKHELFDLLHAVLPTKLPPEEFYAEFASLYERALPLRHRLGGLWRYGVGGSIRMLRQSPRIMRALRNGYRDCERL
jgi:hopanoid C-3 methylase